MMGKTYLSLIQYRRPESGSNLLDADMAKNLLFYSWEPNMSEFRSFLWSPTQGVSVGKTQRNS